MIQEGQGGIFFDSKDVDSCENVLKIVAELPKEELRRMGDINKGTMKGFNKETVNSRMRELYKTV